MSMGTGVGMGMLEIGREMGAVQVGVGRGGQSGTSALTQPSPMRCGAIWQSLRQRLCSSLQAIVCMTLYQNYYLRKLRYVRS